MMRKRVWLPLLFAAILILAGYLFLHFRIWGIRFSGFFSLALAVLVVLGWVLDRLAEGTKHRFWRILRTVFLAAVLFGTACFLALEGYIVLGARTDADARPAALIVLGAGVNGETPSLTLRTRLDAALSYLETRPDAVVVVSGGQGGGERISEAEAMRRYLEEQGLDPSRILMEEQASDTRENLVFSKAVLEEAGCDTADMTVAVVTSDFHLRRAALLAGEAGLRAVGVAAKTTHLHLRVNYYIREAFAVAAWALFGYTG